MRFWRRGSPDMAKALLRIEEAAREKATTLDLSDLGLNAVPEALGQLTVLQTLSLCCRHSSR